MHNDFLLRNGLAKELYHGFAEALPVYDYHNHIDVRSLAGDLTASDPAALWLTCDPYKHRAMRISGVDEFFITGGARVEDKFARWCEIFPMLAGNPLYHWSEMELWRMFGIDTEALPITAANAASLWDRMNEKLPSLGAKSVLAASGTVYTAPCASITDDETLFGGVKEFALVPSLRADDLLMPDGKLLETVGNAAGEKITTYEGYLAALKTRLGAFEKVGCRIVDLALDDGFVYTERKPDGFGDADAVKSDLVRFFARECGERNWKLLLHIGALRSTSRVLRRAAGKAGGYAAIGSPLDIGMIVSMLADFEDAGMPSILLFDLNPADNAALATLTGSFAGGKVGLGSPWWWNDHLYGMRSFFDTVSAYSVLSCFFGMTTDSRSVLSMSRHEYFRRVFCEWLSEKALDGEFPTDEAQLGEIVKRVCHGNAAVFFGA